jgi:hypothetical protein
VLILVLAAARLAAQQDSTTKRDSTSTRDIYQ